MTLALVLAAVAVIALLAFLGFRSRVCRWWKRRLEQHIEVFCMAHAGSVLDTSDRLMCEELNRQIDGWNSRRCANRVGTIKRLDCESQPFRCP